MAEEKLVLKPGVVLQFLSNFELSKEGANFQFTTLDLSGKNVDGVLPKTLGDEIKELYFINFNKNNISDAATLQSCKSCITLDLGINKIKNVAIFTNPENFMNLQYLDLCSNKLSEFPGLVLPQLEFLDVSNNKLEKVNETWLGHENLKVLKCTNNKFKSMAAFKNMPKLEELYLYDNSISSLVGLEGVPALKKLHLRKNKIDKMEEEGLPELPALEYINIRTNRLSKMEDLFRLFQTYVTLNDVNIINCPLELEYSSMNILIAEVLGENPGLNRFCKETITDRHKFEAHYLAKYKWEKAEKERKRKEAEDAAKELEEDQDA